MWWNSKSRRRRKVTQESDLVVRSTWPEYGGPDWRQKRERSITPPPDVSLSESQGGWKTIQQTSDFFTKLPLEIRRRIYGMALGEEMLRLEVECARLDLWRCNGWTRRFWANDGGWKKQHDHGWKFLNYPPEEHKKGRKRKKNRAAINLLCTCRQVYLEAINSIFESQIFVLAIGPHEERVHITYKPTLLYLPYFVLPQRLNQLRRLFIHWNLTPGLYSPLGIAHETLHWWSECWDFLAALPGLVELLIKLQCRDKEQSRQDWAPLEEQLGRYIRRVRVRKRFVVVLPFLECDTGLDVGESGCELRIPENEEVETHCYGSNR